MIKAIVLGLLVAVAFANTHPVNQKIVDEIKKTATTWEPMEVKDNPLSKMTASEIEGLTKLQIKPPTYKFPYRNAENHAMPESFDSRTKWGKCIHAIRNQEKCGSCWAFAGSETLSDRFCIASSGKVDTVLSPEDMVACDSWDMGCSGGNLWFAWDYLTSTGIVTDKCFPYSSGAGVVPQCIKKGQCKSANTAYKKYKCKAGTQVEATTVEAIKRSIFADGPMETGFTVYADFMNYKSGVYVHKTGGVKGGHAVKIIGWGVESGLNYWLVANSWGPAWGLKGFFKIKQGDSGIDSSVWACIPDVASAEKNIIA